MLEYLRKENPNLKLLPIFEEQLKSPNKAMKSDYNVKGGAFNKELRDNNVL